VIGKEFCMRNVFKMSLENIVGMENLLGAWKEFSRGKRDKADVDEFSVRLMENLFALHADVINLTYRHGGYQAFKISDPKPRDIHKASVRDRVLHHALYRVLYPFFERTFIADSFSCRFGRGTHRALNQFRVFSRKAGKNNTRTCWVLKCDVRKFFASINHAVLLAILRRYVADKDVLWLLGEIIGSFYSTAVGIGLPLGNLTSQLLVNVYMNEFDQFVKHWLNVKYYLRYADDFVIISEDRARLENLLPHGRDFLREQLKLDLHPDKVFIQTLASGVDFLGWVHFPDHRVLRTATKRRMFKKLENASKAETIHSYLGLLKHGNAYKLRRKIEEISNIDL
ncbi:MAG: reverse transcriptase/maturase family protein, partial [Patescibacteria group bacterium]